MADVCRQMGISEATYYNWKKRYGNLGLLEVRELRQLRDENARLKRLVADLTLDRHVLQEVIKKDLATPRRRDIARWIRDCFQLSVRRACALSCLRNATWYYRSQARDSSVLRQRIRELATARPRFGYERLHILLDPGGLAGQSQPRASAVQAGGPPGTYESAPAQAHQPAPRTGSHSHGRGSVLGHGFRS